MVKSAQGPHTARSISKGGEANASSAAAEAAAAKPKSKKGRRGSVTVKKKHLKKWKRSDAKDKAKLKKVRGEAPPNVRDLSRPDALTALAGYKVSKSHIEEHLMNETKWVAFLREVGVIGTDFSVRDGKHIFIWSRMRRADEMADATRFSARDQGLLMGFTDFLEGLARLAEKLSLPTMAMVTAEQGRGMNSVKNYVSNHLHSIQKSLKQGTPTLQRRASAKEFSAEKTRPLEEKLLVLLEVIKEILQEGNEISKKLGDSRMKQSGDKTWQKHGKKL